MRDFGQVRPDFWIGDTGRKLRKHRNARLIATYLMTGPEATMSGLYRLTLPALAHEMGMTVRSVSKGLATLSELGFAYYDSENEVIWIPEMARCQIAETLKPNDNRIVGLVREVERYRRSPLYLEFYRRYLRDFNLPSPPPLEAPSEGLARGFEGGPKSLRSQEQEQEQEQEEKAPLQGTPKGLSSDAPLRADTPAASAAPPPGAVFPPACEAATQRGAAATGPPQPPNADDRPDEPTSSNAQQALPLAAPKPSKRAAHPGPSRTEVLEVWEIYAAEWVRTRRPADGKAPTATTADHVQLRTLIGGFGAGEVGRLILRFLEDDDPFLAKHGHALRFLPSRINAYRATTSPPAVARAGPRSPPPLSSSISEETRALRGDHSW